MKQVDGMDITKEGSESLEAAITRYDERIDRVETKITARLRDRLGTAKTANVRELPLVSDSIIKAKQIHRQVAAYMRKVEDVSADWDSFRAKLNTINWALTFRGWLRW